MKRIIVLILMVSASLMLMNSCKLRPLPERMDAFVTSVEKGSASYSQDDWDAANEKFEALCKEYQEKKGSLTLDQIKQVRSAMGRYVAVALRSGMDSVSSTIDDIGGQLPGLIQEIGDAVPGILESIGNALRDLGLTPPDETAPAPAE